MKDLKPRRVKRARLGAVYHPKGNSKYVYVAVSLDKDRVRLLLLCSNSSALFSGDSWDESLFEFERELRSGWIVRIT